MKANDILRRIRYILDLDDAAVISTFAEADKTVSRLKVIGWLKKEDAEGFVVCPDEILAAFLNGLINRQRGKQDGPAQVAETSLSNNAVFRKLKIAFNLQAEEILSILALADVAVSKHELSAFFRRPDDRRYRECKDQILRNFLNGLQLKLRGTAAE